MESALIASLVIFVDQVTKFAITRALFVGERVEVISGILRLTHVRNSGAIFGILKGSSTYLTIFSVAATIFLIGVIYLARRTSALMKFSLGLLLGGAVGNLIDRLRLGEVVDFIDIGVGSLRWPSFNIADAAVTVGVLLILFQTLATPREKVHEGADLEG